MKLEPKKETLEEAAIRAVKSDLFKDETLFIAGAKWQQKQDKNKYSEEEVILIIEKFRDLKMIAFSEWFEQFKKQ